MRFLSPFVILVFCLSTLKAGAEDQTSRVAEEFEFRVLESGSVRKLAYVFVDSVDCTIDGAAFCLNIYRSKAAFDKKELREVVQSAELGASGSERLTMWLGGSATNALNIPVYFNMPVDNESKALIALAAYPGCPDLSSVLPRTRNVLLTFHTAKEVDKFSGEEFVDNHTICRGKKPVPSINDVLNAVVDLLNSDGANVSQLVAFTQLNNLNSNRIQLASFADEQGVAQVGLVVFRSTDALIECDPQNNWIPRGYLEATPLCQSVKPTARENGNLEVGVNRLPQVGENSTDPDDENDRSFAAAPPQSTEFLMSGGSVPIPPGLFSFSMIQGPDGTSCAVPTQNTVVPNGQSFEGLALAGIGVVPSCGGFDVVPIEVSVRGEVSTDRRLSIELRFNNGTSWQRAPASGLLRLGGLFIGYLNDGSFGVVEAVRVTMRGQPMGKPLVFDRNIEPNDLDVLTLEIPPFEIAIADLRFLPPADADQDDMDNRCALRVEIASQRGTFVLRPSGDGTGTYRVNTSSNAGTPPFAVPTGRLPLERSQAPAIAAFPVFPEACEAYSYTVPFSNLARGTFELAAFPSPVTPEIGVLIVSHDELISKLLDDTNKGTDFADSVLRIVNGLAVGAIGKWDEVTVYSISGTAPRRQASQQSGVEVLTQSRRKLFEEMIAQSGTQSLRTNLGTFDDFALRRKEVTGVVIGPSTDTPDMCGDDLRSRVARLRAQRWEQQPVFLFFVNVNEEAIATNETSIQECDFPGEQLPNMRVVEIAYDSFMTARMNVRDVNALINVIITGEMR